jgi:succinate dehydrogenase/fumarate reductase flavoprotein subunit
VHVDIETDVLILGAGPAGMSAAVSAVQNGLRVVVVEKAPHVGGSALLSGAQLWTAASWEALRRTDPDGDPVLAKALVDGFPGTVDWLRQQGLTYGEPFSQAVATGFASHGTMIDIVAMFDRWRGVVQGGENVLALSTVTQKLVVDDRGAVVGAVVVDRDGTTTIGAKAVLLATGGFQGDREMRRRYICDAAAEMWVRSNPHSMGDGLRLALEVGAGTSARMDGFYGHLVPTGLAGYEPPDFIRLAQTYSGRCLLLDRQGNRFRDESLGYFRNAQAVLRLEGGRALLVGDQRIRDQNMRIHRVGGELLDRPVEAAAAGGNIVFADSPRELAKAVVQWGYHDVDAALERFNTAIAAAAEVNPPRQSFRDALVDAPYFAVEVESAITFTQGGIRIDEHGHALDRTDQRIPSLYAAGADAGGIYAGGYAGGLALALVFGRQAARTIVRELGV